MKYMLNFSMLMLILCGASVSFAGSDPIRPLTQINGLIELESPCTVRTRHPGKECLRILTLNHGQGRGIYYIERPELLPESDFKLVKTNVGTLFQMFYDNGKSGIFGQHQPLKVFGKIEAFGLAGDRGGVIHQIDSIEIAHFLSNPDLEF